MAFSTNLEFVKSGGFGGVVESVPHRIASGILADVVHWGKGWRGEPLRVSNHRTLPHMWCQLGTILFLPTTEKKGGLFLGSVFSLCRPAEGEESGRKFGFISVFFAAV